MHSPPSEGFTLIEIIIVISVMAILMAVATPFVSEWIANSTLKGEMQTFYGDLQKARTHAVKSNRAVLFSFTFDAACAGATGYTLTDTDGLVVARGSMPAGICIFNSDFRNGVSGFNQRGFQAEGPPTQHLLKIKHTRTGRTYEISQGINGNITLK